MTKLYEHKNDYLLIRSPPVQTCVVGAPKNRLIETVLRYHQHMFWLKSKPNAFK